jgi:hypothetical protein
LAAAYDEIVERHRQGRITSRQARGEVYALMGRDDAGLVWTINPLNGRWCYRNLRGELVEADPPRFGVPALTPMELGGGPQGDLDRRVTFFEVDADPFVLPPVEIPIAVSPMYSLRAAFISFARHLRSRSGR